MLINGIVRLPRHRKLWLGVGWAKPVSDPLGMNDLIRASVPGLIRFGRLSVMCHLVRTVGLPDASDDLLVERAFRMRDQARADAAYNERFALRLAQKAEKA